MGDFVKKTHAARAFDATLAIENDIGTENLAFAVTLFSLLEPAVLQVMLHVIVLQPALTRLIAYWTIDRMVDQKKFHHRFAHRYYLGALGQHRHALGHLGVAGDLQLGHLLDFDQTHAAIAGDRKLGMIAVMRDRNPRLGRRLNHGLAFDGVNLLTVDIKFYWVHGVKNSFGLL